MTKKSKTEKTPNIVDVSAFPEQTVRDNTLASSKVLVSRDEFSTTVTYTNKPDVAFSLCKGTMPMPAITQRKNGKIVTTGKLWFHYNYTKDNEGIPTDKIKSLVIDSFVPNEWRIATKYINKQGDEKLLVRFYHKCYVMGDDQISAFKELAQVNNELCLFKRNIA